MNFFLWLQGVILEKVYDFGKTILEKVYFCIESKE